MDARLLEFSDVPVRVTRGFFALSVLEERSLYFI